MFVAAMAALDKGQIDPVTEQLMLGAINKQIPTTTTVVPLMIRNAMLILRLGQVNCL